MRRLDLYIFRQIAGPFLFFVLVLTGVIWLGKSLNLIEIIVNNGQSAGVFLELSVLLMPLALAIVLPVAAFGATLYATNRLFSDSEIVVMFATGFSWAALIRPVLMFAGLVTVATWGLTLVVIPGAQRELRTRVAEIKADIISAFLREGAFQSPADGVTVYVRNIGRPGEMLGVFVQDERDPDETATYTAERAVLLTEDEGTRMVMFDGILQLARGHGSGAEPRALSLLRFKQFSYDLTRFTGAAEHRRPKPSEYYLPTLLSITPPEAARLGRPLGAYRAEAHEALSGPLYAPAFTLLAIAFVVGPGFRRRGFLGRILAATGVGLALRLTGLGLKGAATGAAALAPTLYLPPLVGVALALWVLAGRPFASRRRANGAEVPA